MDSNAVINAAEDSKSDVEYEPSRFTSLKGVYFNKQPKAKRTELSTYSTKGRQAYEDAMLARELKAMEKEVWE